MTAAREDLPTGTVTFLFSDIEGSTGLVQRLDTGTYRDLLEQHHRLLRAAVASHAGVERGTQGDAFLVIFRDARSAVAAAVEAQRALAAADWPDGGTIAVRMGLHSGEGIRGGDDYVGLDINRAARIASAAHGGQVLVSDSTRALAARNLPPGVALRDVGEHRLKGLDAPERLHQLTIEGLPEEFPPLRTLGGRSALPPRLTSFVGRREELDDLGRLLEGTRLLTLMGPGGTGKTSLATELARESAAQFADGAWFVALDSIASHELVGSAIVAGLDLRGPSEKPVRERLIENLSGREILLVLDNFEHVLEAARLVGDLLASASALKVVVTSRAPLRLSGEQIYPVLPLALPGEGADEATIASAASVRLFVDRARGGQPGFELTAENADAISEICLRLDGLPLGIELAAARIGLFGPKGIRDRLAQHIALPASPIRDAPTRQRTLHDAIAWSHGLLDPPARALFARMSVFAGGCRLEELEAVCGPAAELGGEPVEILTELTDHSLVISSDHNGAVRFQMLDTIREFAEAELARTPDRERLVRHHADAYLALAERAAPDFELARRRPALELLTPERDNVRAAVQWALASDEGEIALRLCVALAFFWAFRGEFVDAIGSTTAALALPSASRPSMARMRALDAAGTLLYYGGDGDGAGRMYREQLEVALELGDAKGIADARFNLLFTEDWRGRADEALAALDEIAADYRGIGDERFVARADWGRANYMFELGREEEAVELIKELVGRFRALDDPRYESMAVGSLAAAALGRGDRESALRHFLASFGRNRDLGDVAGVTTALPILAAAALQLAGPEAAATVMAAYEALSKRYGLRMPRTLEQFISSVDIDPLEVARAALDPETFARATERGREMTYSDVAAYVQEVFRGGAAGSHGGPPDQAGGQIGA